MNLPILGELKANESTYITFSKSLLDFDKAVSNSTPFFFSKMVAIKLPSWKESSNGTHLFVSKTHPLTNVGYGASTLDPNVCIPKYIQHYLENICRQNYDEQVEPYIQEIAFWKMLNVLSSNRTNIVTPNNTIKFVNQVVISDFQQLETNVGWGRIIAQIPSQSKCLIPNDSNFKLIQTPSIIITNDLYDAENNRGLYDTTNKEITFQDVKVLENYKSLVTEQKDWSFNCILLYYQTGDGIDRLHGINFIDRWENKLNEWTLPEFNVNTSNSVNIGYQFIFNLKTCVNQATIDIMGNDTQLNWWNGFERAFDKMNSVLTDLQTYFEYQKSITNYKP